MSEISKIIKQFIEDKDRESTNKLKSDPFTIEQLKELADKLEPKTVFMNQKMYHMILQQIDFEPPNIAINNFLPDNQAIIMSESQLKSLLP